MARRTTAITSEPGGSHAVDHATGQPIIAKDSVDSLANPKYSQEPFIDFEHVDPDTDLETLNLNWRERDLPERERTKHVHRLHPYLGKYVPQLVEIFVRKFQPTHVCDPFAGCGTTLVEAAALGIDAFGVDVSPFNCLLTKVKTDVYDLDELKGEVYDILDRSDVNGRTLFSPEQDESTYELSASDYILKWFAPRAQDELLSYCALIPDYKYADVLKIILSRSARSARLVPHHELDFPREPQREPYKCRKHRRTCRPVQGARKFIERYSRDTIERIAKFAQIRRQATVTIACGDSRATEFPPADLLVTSPPYVGLIDYHEQHRYSYELLSLLPEPFASVGYMGSDTLDSEELEIGPASRGKSKAARQSYIDGIVEALDRAVMPMPSGSHIVIVINDKHGLYGEIACMLPVEHIGNLNRHVNRRTGRRNGAFYEQVLIWRKSP